MFKLGAYRKFAIKNNQLTVAEIKKKKEVFMFIYLSAVFQTWVNSGE